MKTLLDKFAEAFGGVNRFLAKTPNPVSWALAMLFSKRVSATFRRLKEQPEEDSHATGVAGTAPESDSENTTTAELQRVVWQYQQIDPAQCGYLDLGNIEDQKKLLKLLFDLSVTVALLQKLESEEAYEHFVTDTYNLRLDALHTFCTQNIEYRIENTFLLALGFSRLANFLPQKMTLNNLHQYAKKHLREKVAEQWNLKRQSIDKTPPAIEQVRSGWLNKFDQQLGDLKRIAPNLCIQPMPESTQAEPISSQTTAGYDAQQYNATTVVPGCSSPRTLGYAYTAGVEVTFFRQFTWRYTPACFVGALTGATIGTASAGLAMGLGKTATIAKIAAVVLFGLNIAATPGGWVLGLAITCSILTAILAPAIVYGLGRLGISCGIEFTDRQRLPVAEAIASALIP